MSDIVYVFATCVLALLTLNSILTGHGTGRKKTLPIRSCSLLTGKICKVVAPAEHPGKKVLVLLICDCVFCVSFISGL